LNVVRKAGRQSVDIEFFGVPAFRFQKDLVSGFVCELNNLVLDGGTVAGSGPFDAAGIESRFV
jgi:hypothetical protein